MADSTQNTETSDLISAEDLLAQVQALLEEANPTLAARTRVELQSRFEQDLGLDSLSRVEMIARVERRYGVRLPESMIAEAQTPADLLEALGMAPQLGAVSKQQSINSDQHEGLIEPLPNHINTLVEALAWYAEHYPQRVHVHLKGEDGQVTALRYEQLYQQSKQVAAGLQQQGMQVGDAVAVMLPTGSEYLSSFLGIQFAGGIPVPIYPPARPKQIEEHFRRHAKILENAQAKYLVTFDRVKSVSRLLMAQTDCVKSLWTHGELISASAGVTFNNVEINSDSIAFIQYTSGSTGDPKGVVLTQANILASIRCMARALDARSNDVFVSWLPLYHDMGLIGAWLGALVTGFPLVLMSPLSFLHHPVEWLRVIHEFGGTLSGGPNFAYELCLRRISDDDLNGLDLSSWRVAFNGAEPVSKNTMEGFSQRYSDYGFDSLAMTPVYGLAEATLGVAFTPKGRGARVDRVDREQLFKRALAAPAKAQDEVLEFVSCGLPIPEFEVRIVDDASHELPDRAEGEVEFKGPSVTQGYYRNETATQALVSGDWRRSGDRGYLADGELYLTGRDKDVVIRAGRNLYPYALEQAVADIDGVRRGCVAVFGSLHPDDGTERLVVVAESRESDQKTREDIRGQIESLALEHLGLAADEVILAPPQTILKTSSGKIRRAALAQLYTLDELIVPQRPVWQQLLRLGVGPTLSRLRRILKRIGELAYATWVGIVLALLTLVTWPLVVCLPGRRRRHGLARFSARLLLWLTAVPIKVQGLEHIPTQGPWILVSNHQSFLDGFVLSAIIPAQLQFVTKAELRDAFIPRKFLEAIGCLFVERFNKEQSVRDNQQIITALSQGSSVAFFPEGTFHRMPGLLPFQSGAFEAAVQSKAPVLPVVIRGTRNVLRGDEMFPRLGRVNIEVLAPEQMTESDAQDQWRAATTLRHRIRARMLAVCAEPDLDDRNALAELSEHLTKTVDKG